MATLLTYDRLFAFLGKLLNSNPNRWVWRSPVIGYVAYPFLAVLLCLSATTSRADMLPSLSWNCWISGQNPAQISCIHKRKQLQKPALEDIDSELEALILGQLQEKKRNGNTAKVEGVEWRNIDVLHKEPRWTIQVHFYPQGKLLDESQLNKLATAVLCASDIPCAVTVRNTKP